MRKAKVGLTIIGNFYSTLWLAALLHHFPLGDINLGGVHLREGPVVGFFEEQCLSLAHRQRQVSAAWCNRVSTDIPWWARGGWWHRLTPWCLRWQAWWEASPRSNTLEMGWRKEVEVTSKVCAQGALFRLYQGVRDGGGWGTRPCPII
jgi:hypothetical protein